MIAFYSSAHELHNPAREIFRGELVPAYEVPRRAEIVHAELVRRGHSVSDPTADAATALARVHGSRYLAFLEAAWGEWCALHPDNADTQPFPSVWPVRTLRHDVEPTDFVARLGLYSMDNGSPMAAGTWTAARAAADCAASAAEELAKGERAAFAACRPPGHHAGSDFMGGYCFLNTAAVAAETLKAAGCERVAVLDVDYHHGNGTQAIFYARADVLFASIHGDPRTEYPFFSGFEDETGAGEGEGFNLNLPLPAGASTALWFDGLERACARISDYAPDALVVSLGLDTFAGDPIARFSLATADFTRVGMRLAALGLPTAFVLEGGYAADELGVNAVNVLDGFEATAS